MADQEACKLVKASRIIQDFVASITIPSGFCIADQTIEEKFKYHDYITLDRNALKMAVVEELYPSKITIPQQTDSLELECLSRVRAIKLSGPLFYNAVVTGFKPVAEARHDEKRGEIIVSPATAFSTSDTIDIDFNLGYICYECNYSPDIISGFDIIIEQRTEFLVTPEGHIIFKKSSTTQEEDEEFFKALDGKGTVTISYPFSIVLQPK